MLSQGLRGPHAILSRAQNQSVRDPLADLLPLSVWFLLKMLRGLKTKAKAQGNINLRQSAWKDTKVGRLHM